MSTSCKGRGKVEQAEASLAVRDDGKVDFGGGEGLTGVLEDYSLQRPQCRREQKNKQEANNEAKEG